MLLPVSFRLLVVCSVHTEPRSFSSLNHLAAAAVAAALRHLLLLVTLQGVGSAWGAEAWVLPPAPRFLDMEELLAEAKACDATLLLLLDDSTTADGQLQVRQMVKKEVVAAATAPGFGE